MHREESSIGIRITFCLDESLAALIGRLVSLLERPAKLKELTKDLADSTASLQDAIPSDAAGALPVTK